MLITKRSLTSTFYILFVVFLLLFLYLQYRPDDERDGLLYVRVEQTKVLVKAKSKISKQTVIERLVEAVDRKTHRDMMRALRAEVRIGSRYSSNFSINRAFIAKKHRTLPSYVNMVDLRSKVETNDRGFICFHTATRPNFTICTYDRERDVYISGSLVDSGIWDYSLTVLLSASFALYPRATFIDIGANIGYCSLLASVCGLRAIAVEPVRESVELFKASVQAERMWNRVTVLRNAISDGHFSVAMTTSPDNQGNRYVIENASSADEVKTVTLDDLHPLVHTSTAILKINVEGYECRAFSKASALFSRVFIPYVFMQWSYTAHRTKNIKSICTVRQVQTVSRYLTCLGYLPFRQHGDVEYPLEPFGGETDWNRSVLSVVWIHRRAKNLWTT